MRLWELVRIPRGGCSSLLFDVSVVLTVEKIEVTCGEGAADTAAECGVADIFMMEFSSLEERLDIEPPPGVWIDIEMLNGCLKE